MIDAKNAHAAACRLSQKASVFAGETALSTWTKSTFLTIFFYELMMIQTRGAIDQVIARLNYGIKYLVVKNGVKSCFSFSSQSSLSGACHIAHIS